MVAKDGYHHGNLRRALLDESLAVIGDKGVEGLSLREVATRVGVSNAAPYHHFADKTALLSALAYEAMDLMDQRMAAAQAEAGADAMEQLLAIGMAYVEFAVERPDYYAAMTAAELNAPAAQSSAPPPEAGGGDTWQRLLSAVIACQQAGELPQGDPVILAVFLWSLVHGLAELWRGGPLQLMPQAADGLAPMARRVLMSGLGGMEAVAEQQVGDAKDAGENWTPCEKES